MGWQFPWQFPSLLKIINITIVTNSNLLAQSSEAGSRFILSAIHQRDVLEILKWKQQNRKLHLTWFLILKMFLLPETFLKWAGIACYQHLWKTSSWQACAWTQYQNMGRGAAWSCTGCTVCLSHYISISNEMPELRLFSKNTYISKERPLKPD